MSRIRVTIDELVLRGVGAAERTALIEALRVELARALAHPARSGRLTQAHRTPVIRLGTIDLGPGAAGGRRFGAGLARRIAGNLAGPRATSGPEGQMSSIDRRPRR